MVARHSWQQLRTHAFFCRRCGFGREYLPDYLRNVFERGRVVAYRTPACDGVWPEGWKPEWKRERGEVQA